MAWQNLHLFSINMKDKPVRFKTNHMADNLSNMLLDKTTFPKKINVPRGAIGRIYSVIGGKIFIGFGPDLSKLPNASSADRFSATVECYISDIDKLEIDM